MHRDSKLEGTLPVCSLFLQTRGMSRKLAVGSGLRLLSQGDKTTDNVTINYQGNGNNETWPPCRCLAYSLNYSQFIVLTLKCLETNTVT